MLGEFLWQLTEKGQARDLLIPTVGQNAASGGQAPQADLLTIQNDEIFIPMSWEVTALPVVGVTRAIYCSIFALPIGAVGGERTIFIEQRQIQADSATLTSWRFGNSNSNIVIPPAYVIRCVVAYDLINAGNFVTGRIYGFKLPKGNLVST